MIHDTFWMVALSPVVASQSPKARKVDSIRKLFSL
jgi:hypothetical protein